MMQTKFERQKEKYKIPVIAILLAVACFSTIFHVVLETSLVFTHFFYIPIILVSLWWKRKGLVVAIFLAGLLILSHIVFRRHALTLSDYFRASMFIVIAFVVGGLSERIAKAEERINTGGGSSDVAEVCRVTAYQTIRIPGCVPGDIGHHWSRTAGNVGSANWKAINACAKVMAGTALDLMTKPEALKKVRDNVAANIKEYGVYKPYLAPDALPPNDLNAELMEKWGPKMEPTYLQP